MEPAISLAKALVWGTGLKFHIENSMKSNAGVVSAEFWVRGVVRIDIDM